MMIWGSWLHWTSIQTRKSLVLGIRRDGKVLIFKRVLHFTDFNNSIKHISRDFHLITFLRMLFNELENSFEPEEAGEVVPEHKEENTGKIKEPKFDGSINLAHNM